MIIISLVVYDVLAMVRSIKRVVLLGGVSGNVFSRSGISGITIYIIFIYLYRYIGVYMKSIAFLLVLVAYMKKRRLRDCVYLKIGRVFVVLGLQGISGYTLRYIYFLHTDRVFKYDTEKIKRVLKKCYRNVKGLLRNNGELNQWGKVGS